MAGRRSTRRQPPTFYDSLRDFRAEAGMYQTCIKFTLLEMSLTRFLYSDFMQTPEGAAKIKTLEDLFRPPLDLMFRGQWEAVSIALQVFQHRW